MNLEINYQIGLKTAHLFFMLKWAILGVCVEGIQKWPIFGVSAINDMNIMKIFGWNKTLLSFEFWQLQGSHLSKAIKNKTWNWNHIFKNLENSKFSRESKFQNIIINVKVLLSNKIFHKINGLSSKIFRFSPFLRWFSVMIIWDRFRVGFNLELAGFRKFELEFLLIWKLKFHGIFGMWTRLMWIFKIQWF